MLSEEDQSLSPDAPRPKRAASPLEEDSDVPASPQIKRRKPAAKAKAKAKSKAIKPPTGQRSRGVDDESDFEGSSRSAAPSMSESDLEDSSDGIVAPTKKRASAKAKAKVKSKSKAKAKSRAKAKAASPRAAPKKKKLKTDDDDEPEVNPNHHYRKPGQKFHIPSNGDGIRVFYESSFEQNPSNYLAIKYMVEYGCLEMGSADLDEAYEKYTYLRQEGAFKRLGGIRDEYQAELQKIAEKWEGVRAKRAKEKEAAVKTEKLEQ